MVSVFVPIVVDVRSIHGRIISMTIKWVFRIHR